MTRAQIQTPPAAPEVITGVQIMRGLGVQEPKGFWADAWSYVLKRRGAVAALMWVGIVFVLAVLAPVIASGHPLVLRIIEDGQVVDTTYPILRFIKPIDVLLLLFLLVGVPVAIWAGPAKQRADRFGVLIAVSGAAIVVSVVGSVLLAAAGGRSTPAWVEALGRLMHLSVAATLIGGLAVLALGMALPISTPRGLRAAVLIPGILLGGLVSGATWGRPLENFDYLTRARAGEVRATYTLVPFSPSQRYSELNRRPPMTSLGEGLELAPGTPGAKQTFYLGTDAFGTDVLTQLLHACRLSISIGLVSTGVALLIGVTMGALMGYYGGWVDLILYRVVEVFMAVPVLFLLIVAVSVLPTEMRSTYVLMAIIGCFTWTGMARFTRAEFLKLRNQDFVQSARSVGLPVRSILFKHMLPNGVAPVLVDTSFAVAAAITVEAVLSYLGLGPIDQASWGKLLASAMNPEGQFKWWLAVFPGVAIFLTVLSYNLIGEALRDAIDPKLKKARV
jgi:peptide/nickel transport system permease protein